MTQPSAFSSLNATINTSLSLPKGRFQWLSRRKQRLRKVIVSPHSLIRIPLSTGCQEDARKERDHLLPSVYPSISIALYSLNPSPAPFNPFFLNVHFNIVNPLALLEAKDYSFRTISTGIFQSTHRLHLFNWNILHREEKTFGLTSEHSRSRNKVVSSKSSLILHANQYL